MRKFLCWIISLATLTVGLCGCDGNKQQNGSTDSGMQDSVATSNVVVLEDFSEVSSRYCLAGATRFKTEETRGEHLESYADRNGVTAEGVGYASLRQVDNCMVVRFNKTQEALSTIYDEIETIVVRILIKHGDDNNRIIKVFDVGKNIPTNEWTDFTVTKTEIINCLNNNALQNMISAKEQFVKNFCSNAIAHEPRMIATTCHGFNTEVYIDSIIYTPVSNL